MIVSAAGAALPKLFTAEYRAVLFKSLGLTALALIGLWFALTWIFDALAISWLEGTLPDQAAWSDWLSAGAGLLAGLVIAVGLALLIAPVTAIIAGFFLDDVAELVERSDYPRDAPGRALPFAQAVAQSVKFFGVVILGNLLALVLLLVPFVNLAAFFLVNGYLLGREYFEFAAMRFAPEAEAKALRRRHGGTIFLAGLVIAAFLAVPLLNLMTPLFAATFMVHIHKRLAHREASSNLDTVRES